MHLKVKWGLAQHKSSATFSWCLCALGTASEAGEPQMNETRTVPSMCDKSGEDKCV